MKPSEMPKHPTAKPVQGRYTRITSKWNRLGNDQSWDEPNNK